MKKFLLSFGVIGMFLLYSWHQNQETQQATIIKPSNTMPTQPVTEMVTSVPTATGSAPPTLPSATPKPIGQYKDGEYTGDQSDAFYGNIQVKAVIQNGKIADVIFLQYPNDRSTSIEINSQAMPYLKQEAIAAQSANVDIISGATDSSIAFRQSLNSALSQAKI